MNGLGTYDAIGNGMFWFTICAGFVAGFITAALLYIPYRNHRLTRMIEKSDIEVERITHGLHTGRHSAEPDLSDGVGALAAAREAGDLRVIYPGPGRIPEPEWVSWVEEHGKYAPKQPKDKTAHEQPRSHRMLVAVLLVVSAVLWHLDRMVTRATTSWLRAWRSPKYSYQLLWAAVISVLYRTPKPKPAPFRAKRQYHLVAR